ncbi:hypothetical protein Bbelb_275940 [Branchiostoma belcheri]|nr:hypothetical protein Bbelb_275940 [Branchiostoma belcheri]
MAWILDLASVTLQNIPGCGWCDVTQECLAGTGLSPNDTICPSWFYYGCFSVGDTSSCSEHIEDLSCDQTHCDETKNNYNPDVCEHCRSVEACFDQDVSPDFSYSY